jgi:hypothetical protein
MTEKPTPDSDAQAPNRTTAGAGNIPPHRPAGWKRFFPSQKASDEGSSGDSNEEYKDDVPTAKWSLGILNDKKTEEVPGQYTHPIPSRLSAAFDSSARYCPSPFLQSERTSWSSTSTREVICIFTAISTPSSLKAGFHIFVCSRKEENRRWANIPRSTTRRFFERSIELANLEKRQCVAVFGLLLHAWRWYDPHIGRWIQ